MDCWDFCCDEVDCGDQDCLDECNEAWGFDADYDEYF
jgi:hypothetical protein